MITKRQAGRARRAAARLLKKAGIVLTARERRNMEVADFGLGEPASTGLEIITYVNNGRYCAKELVLLPGQACPEHRHPPVGGMPGKMETFRCRWGVVYLHVPGKKTMRSRARPPRGRERTYTAGREIRLKPGGQYTIPPDTPHWFKAGPEGAVVSEFSSPSRDDKDLFRDPEIKRKPVIR